MPVVIPTLQPPVAAYGVPVRQTLTFTVDWRVFTAGTAVFQIDQVGTVEKVTATGDTLGAVNMLFPVVDKFQAGFDTKTGCSTGFSKQLSEGRRKVTGDLTFDYNAGKQTLVETEPGEGDFEDADGFGSGLRGRLAFGDVLCRDAGAGGGAGCAIAAGGCDEDSDGGHEGGGEGRDQDACGNVSDDPGAAYGGGRVW